MDLVHSKSTAIAEKKNRPTAPEGIGGAIYFATDDLNKLPPRYELVMAADMEELVNHGDPIFGNTEENILTQLLHRHPSPHTEGTYLWRFDEHMDFRDPETLTQGGYRRRRRRWDHDKVRINGWLVMEQMIFQDILDLTALAEITHQFGPILVPSDSHRILGDTEGLRAAGFTSVQRRFDLFQINHNPKRTRLHGYNEALKLYEQRTTGEFPDEALAAIFNLMRTQNLSDPWDVGIQITERTRPNARQIMDLVEINRRLGLSPDWRDKGARHHITSGRHRWTESYTFKEAIAACLPVLHAEEGRILEREHNSRWELCRFVRREAKALKMSIPPKPKEPKKPKPKKRKRTKTTSKE